MNRSSLLVAAALAVGALTGGAVAGTAAAVTPPVRATTTLQTPVAVAAVPQLGVHLHALWEMYWNGQTPNAMFERHLRELAAHKVQIIRVDLGWSESQPTAAAPSMTSWHNTRLNTVINRIRAKGMKVFLTVHQSPEWARPGTGANLMQYPTDPATMKPWLAFIAKNFGPRLAGLEVWNEPNLVEFTGVSDPNERAAAYVRLLKVAYPAIKAADPTLRVIFGGTAQTDDVFLTQAYAAGAHGYFDALGVHPYQGNQTKAPESTDITGKSRITNMPAVIAAMKANGDGAKPIWWTEFGTAVQSNVGITKTWLLGVPTDQIAGDYMVRSFMLAGARYPQVKVGVLYTAYRPSDGISAHQYGYRLLDADGTVHAQLTMLKAMRLSTPSR